MKILLSLSLVLLAGTAIAQAAPTTVTMEAGTNPEPVCLILWPEMHQIPCVGILSAPPARTELAELVPLDLGLRSHLLLQIPPPAPPHSVTLTWTAGPGSIPAKFTVYRGAVTGGPYASIASPIVTTFVDPFQFSDEGRTLFYAVSQTNGAGTESGKSGEVSATIPYTTPNPPINVTAVAK
jgi:hypothetical protein